MSIPRGKKRKVPVRQHSRKIPKGTTTVKQHSRMIKQKTLKLDKKITHLVKAQSELIEIGHKIEVAEEQIQQSSSSDPEIRGKIVDLKNAQFFAEHLTMRKIIKADDERVEVAGGHYPFGKEKKLETEKAPKIEPFPYSKEQKRNLQQSRKLDTEIIALQNKLRKTESENLQNILQEKIRKKKTNLKQLTEDFEKLPKTKKAIKLEEAHTKFLTYLEEEGV